MRRNAAILVVVALVLGIAGCAGRPAGVDGNLTDDWPALADARMESPIVGTCHTGLVLYEWFGPFTPYTIDCAAEHTYETIYIGTFPQDLSGKPDHPDRGSTALAPLFRLCTTNGNAFLGDDWQDGYVTLQLSVPSSAAWRAGARWFACNASRTTDNFQHEPTVMTGSLRGALGPTGSLRRGCETVTEDADHYLLSEESVDCSVPHNAEFAGLLRLTDAKYPTDNDTRWTHENYACNSVFKNFLGIPYGTSDYFGFFHDDITEEQWNLGVRTMACILLGYDKNDGVSDRFTGSVKGLHNRRPQNWKEG